MSRAPRNNIKTEQISIRLPVDLLEDLEILKQRDGIDRSVLIIKALRYWVSVEGNISTDNEFVNQIHELKEAVEIFQKNISAVSASYEKETAENRQLLIEQQTTINTLLRMIAKEN